MLGSQHHVSMLAAGRPCHKLIDVTSAARIRARTEVHHANRLSDSLDLGRNILPDNRRSRSTAGAIQPGSIRIGLQSIETGLTSPVFATAAPGDPNDLFVVDQTGKINVIHNGVVQPTPLLDIRSIENAIPLQAGYDERGLLGLAFSPGFNDPTSSGFHTLYTYQSEAAGTATADFAPAAGTVTSGIDHQNVLVQWKVIAANPLVVDTSTRRDLLREDHPASNHNGGTIAFGPDGDLYLGLGDGGSANDSGNGHIASTGNAESLSVIMGKMLRIDLTRLATTADFRLPRPDIAARCDTTGREVLAIHPAHDIC